MPENEPQGDALERLEWEAVRHQGPTLGEHDTCVEDAEIIRSALRRLAEIERRVIYRTEDMPERAVAWRKLFDNHAGWVCLYEHIDPYDGGHSVSEAPDLRSDESGPIFLPIIDAPDAGKGE